ncbi:MAG TPA: hypothetical protein GXX51_03245 [Firmicutes bacterium]|nr:hypothetical protein [Bacillota bacterium]
MGVKSRPQTAGHGVAAGDAFDGAMAAMRPGAQPSLEFRDELEEFLRKSKNSN